MKTIVTHSGPFHADDVCAAVILKLVGEVKDFSAITRTRDPGVIAKADIAFDVGGIYDPKKGQFDHHQKGGDLIVAADGHKLSSAGMLHLAYHGGIAEMFSADYGLAIGSLVKSIDMADTGEALGESPMSLVIHEFNPVWDSKESHDSRYVDACEYLERVVLKSTVMQDVLWVGTNRAHHAKALSRAKTIVAEATVKDGVLILNKYAPWAEHIQARPDWAEIKFVVFESNGTHMVFQKPTKEDPSASGMPLPKEWAGLRDVELATASGVPDAVFCHVGRFCAGAKSHAGALDLAAKAIEINNH